MKNYGMSTEACGEVEQRLSDLKEYIRDEGGDPKTVLSSMLSGSAPVSDEEEPAATEASEVEAAEGEEAPAPRANANKLAMAISAMKRKLG